MFKVTRGYVLATNLTESEKTDEKPFVSRKQDIARCL